MSNDQRIELKNQVAGRLRELKLIKDPLDEMSLAKMKVIEFYAWLCKNQ